MTRDEQIAALRVRLAEIEASLVLLEAAKAATTNPDDKAELSARISESQQKRETIQQMINNLEGASGPMALAAGLTPSIARRKVEAHNRAMVRSAKSAAVLVHKRVSETLKLMAVEPVGGGTAVLQPGKKKRP